MATQPVLVVREMFMLDGAYTSKGQVISDPVLIEHARAQHPDKVTKAVHQVADAPEAVPEPASAQTDATDA